jgi:hypothetical protein
VFCSNYLNHFLLFPAFSLFLFPLFLFSWLSWKEISEFIFQFSCESQVEYEYSFGDCSSDSLLWVSLNQFKMCLSSRMRGNGLVATGVSNFRRNGIAPYLALTKQQGRMKLKSRTVSCLHFCCLMRLSTTKSQFTFTFCMMRLRTRMGLSFDGSVKSTAETVNFDWETLLAWKGYINLNHTKGWLICFIANHSQGIEHFTRNCSCTFVRNWLCSRHFTMDSRQSDKWSDPSCDRYVSWVIVHTDNSETGSMAHNYYTRQELVLRRVSTKSNSISVEWKYTCS